MKYFAGIGSRKTPKEIGKYIIDVVCPRMIELGYILRSGGASGADTYFEEGYRVHKGKVEIYLPWEKFNNNISSWYTVTDEAIELAKSVHPIGNHLSGTALLFHARNCYQILGYDLKTKSDLVICWTPDGCENGNKTSKDTGGTGQALRLATKYGIPIKNLQKSVDFELVF